jgi:prolyl-tRNA editing enzyme YbaK/EbsC (Cys-tRNA(Pro) deacylase)
VSTTKVFDYLFGRGVPFAVFPHKGAATPLTTAKVYGVEQDLVRTVALQAAVGPALAVVPWERELDLDLARTALRDPTARGATPDEVASRFAGFEPNAIPPLGLFFLMSMVVDPAVVRLRQVAFPGGKASCLMCARRAQLFRGDVYLVAPLTKESLPERLPRRERSGTGLAGTETTTYPG